MHTATLDPTEARPEIPLAARPGAVSRREFTRFAATQVIASGDWERVVDISLGGVCLEGAEGAIAPSRGDRITVILTDEHLYHTAMIEAEVVWRAGERAGLRWLCVDSREQDWLRERCTRGGRVLARGWVARG